MCSIYRLLLCACLSLLFCGAVNSQDRTARVDVNAMQAALQRDYEIYNHRYFHDSLPPATVFYEDAPDDVEAETFIHGNAVSIYIVPIYNLGMNNADFALLHEQCHVETGTGLHGPAWQDCMHRLAKQGAFDTLW